MAPRIIQPIRPVRVWMPRPPVQRVGARGTGRGRGAVSASGIDTSSTGNIGGDFVKAINASIQNSRQNAIANQLMNTGPTGQPGGGVTQNLGQLPADGGPQDFTLPDTSGGLGPDVGSLIHTGGLGELQMRQQAAQQDLADQLTKARIAAALRQAGGNPLQDEYTRARIAALKSKTGKPGKPGKYVAGTGDVQNDPATDDFGQIGADFDAQHGKGAYNVFTKNFSNLKPDGKGNLVVSDNDGNPIMNKEGNAYAYSIPQQDGAYWINRYNAARVRGGQDRIGDLPAGTNPTSGVASGQSQINPIPVKTNLEARALPNGTWIQLPDGSTQQIQRSAKATTQPPSTQADTTEQSEPTLDEEDQSDQENLANQ